MLQRTNKLLIGKDINREADVTAATGFSVLMSNTVEANIPLDEGAVVVLDKNKKPLAAGSTVSDSDVIFICQGTGVVYNYSNPSATVYFARKIVISDPIQGNKVKNYVGTSYVAKVEQVTTITPSATIVPGTEYVLRIVYKDMPEHPGQFTQTYRYTATAATVKNLLDGLTPIVNAHKGRRITASDNDAVLTLTAREISECATALTDIDDFSMVEFEAFLNYVDADGNWQEVAGTTANTPAQYGVGNWEQVRDMEKAQLGYQGVMNKTCFPVITPTMSTTVNSCYDIIVIEHDASYLSPDNQYVKQAPKTTVIALATASNGVNAGTQTANILAVLNPWMNSIGFNNITI